MNTAEELCYELEMVENGYVIDNKTDGIKMVVEDKDGNNLNELYKEFGGTIIGMMDRLCSCKVKITISIENMND